MEKTKEFIKRNTLLMVFIIICAVFAVLTDQFLTISNISDVIKTNTVNGLLAVGLTYVILSGGIDLSVDATVCLAGLAAGYLSNIPVLAVLAGVAIGAAVGLFNGAVLEKSGVQPFIFTLAMSRVVRGIVMAGTKGKNYYLISEKLTAIVRSSFFGIPTLIIIFVIIVAVTFVALNRGCYGRHVYAVGSNEEAARLSGIRTARIKVSTYLIAGMLAGLAGVLLTARLSGAETNAADGWSLDAVSAVIIGGTSLRGGRGGIMNTMLGVFIIAVLNNGMVLMGIPTHYNQLVKGLLMLGAVLLDVSNRKKA
ncbi:ABC transporter permease [Ruminococcus gauvreauii]|uniref:ABC transporter permease n=1 Tax=Ruminococcus gauvreauii TaxID=438033 RepID=A0ABY5VDP2_9FIRM|nr:ABC transporter permease [Ruminococcus gauvreauii]UWP58318.1 ABC transporter permease [Ruminococcus gauvreauii]